MNNTGLKSAEARIQQRVSVRAVHGMNADMSMDARIPLTPVKERVKGVKTSKSTANGQYSKETTGFVKFKVVFYPYLKNQVFRRDMKTGKEFPILEKIDGEWFPCEGIMLTSNEINQMKAFAGAAGLDVDAAIARKRPQKSAPKGTTSIGGKYTYRTGGNVNPDKNEKRRDKQKAAADKQRSLLASVQLANVKR